MEWGEIGKWAAGIVATLIGGGVVVRIAFSWKASRTERSTTQILNRAGGDIVGGDKVDKR